MKGKIYKNRLSSAGPNDQLLTNQSVLINQLYKRSPSPKSSFHPINQYQQQQTFMRNQTTQENERFHRSPDRTIINNLFADTNYGRMQQLKKSTILLQQKPSIIDHINGINENSRPTSQINKRMLKRVVSNPDLNSGQQNIQMADNSFMNNTTNSRTILSPNKINTRTPLKGNNTFGTSENFKNMNRRTITFENQLSNMNRFDSLPLDGNVSAQFSTNLYNPLPQAANCYFQNDQNSRIRQPLTSDYIVSYQKRHKQRVSALQSQHELQMQFLEQEIKSRDNLIQEMKRMLRQKEQIIKKLQNQNASLSSRSYASFCNGNNGHGTRL